MANECTRLLYEIFALVVPISHSYAGKARTACLLESNAHLLKIKEENVLAVIKLKKNITDVFYIFPR